jgi:hypothetical protein
MNFADGQVGEAAGGRMPYEITERGMAEMHRRLNRRLFGGGLGDARFAVGRSLRSNGHISCPRATIAEARLMAEGLLAAPFAVPLITLSARQRWTRADAERVMAHEMVHQWEWETHGPRRARGGRPHGPLFLAKAAEINAALGEEYVAVRRCMDCADDGRARPVALLEFGDGTTAGCSTERRFTSKARRHIRDAARRTGATVVFRFRTMCPNAARLPNANRTRVRLIHGGSRIRVPWPAVSDSLRDELLRAAEGKIICTWPRTSANP